VRWEHAALDQLLRQGVISGDLFQRGTSLQVTPTVAHMYDVQPRPRHVGHGQDGVHFW
jgi:hypothetical protein